MAIIDDRMKNIKLESVRIFVRELFINGFRDRNGLNQLADNKTRAADENRQIIASILREYYKFEKKDGERYFIAIDTRQNRHNPIHNIWKTKAFSGAGIMMHFYILDYLRQNEDKAIEITRERIFKYLQSVASYDESDIALVFEKKDGTEKTISENLTESKLYDKLKEMTELGLIKRYRGSSGYYYSLGDLFNINGDMLDFASEVMPISTIGSYLLDRMETRHSLFTFKHNMISQVVDDGVMFVLFEAINQQREITLDVYSRTTKRYTTKTVVPFFIMRNVQTGRQYVACWDGGDAMFKPLRLDYLIMKRNSIGRIVDDYYSKKKECKDLYNDSWGVNIFYTDQPPKRISFTIQVDKQTNYIARRLEREKRNGKVENLGNWKYRFSMNLYDPIEILPWISTFYGCIVDLETDDNETMEKLKKNFETMMKNHLSDKECKEVTHAQFY